MSHTKAQISLEFMVLVGFVLLAFTIYTPILWQQQNEILGERKTLIGEKIALTLKNEIDMAVMFGSGYERNFTIPDYILNSKYTITVHDRIINVKWDTGETQEMIITNRTSGIPSPGKNTILNEDDEIVFK